MVISIFQFILPIGHSLALASKDSITFLMYFVLVIPLPRIFSSVCEILQSQGVPCRVELDDILVYAEGKDNSLRATQLAF